ncbi:MAG: ABC transporter substrate-binding protein [Desulfobacterales bacterium]|nr:ABC transporter substrate-binding protein [Desulfobacterales bacterium]
MKTKIKIIIGLAVALIMFAIITVVFKTCFSKEGNDVIHIALAGPMTDKKGDEHSVGISFKRGVGLYIDEINRKGGVNGKKIVLDIYDDRNNSDEATEKAYEIVDKDRVVAVIGHHFSSCSINAGRIYEKHKIPAITPASTNVAVTDTEWYFRSVFNDNLQGRFLANFAKRISKDNTISIISEDDAYGDYIAGVFEETAKRLGLKVKYKWNYKLKDKDLDEVLSRIVGELQLKKDAGTVFLASHAGEGAKLLKLIRSNYIKNTIIVPDSFASETFQQSFKDGKRPPSFYTDGIYVTTPLIFDMMGEKGFRFREAYMEKYDVKQKEVGWHAAFAYDTAMVLIEAIRHTEIKGDQKTLREDRKKIRDHLAKLTDIEDAIEGVTGYNFFDGKGDSQKPVFIGVYKDHNIISALTQYRAVPDITEISDLQEELDRNRILMFNGKYSYKINVVYTGIEINEISDLDIDNYSCMLDFHLWFRYQGKIDVQSIEFLNAIEPIQLKDPDLEKGKGELKYRLYHVKGKFRTDFLPSQYRFGHHLLGLSFRPRGLNRNNLIFVKDELGMKQASGKEMKERMKDDQVLNPIYGWTISDVWFFQDIAKKNSLGDPEYLSMIGGILEYSRFNVGIQITKDKFNLRQLIPIDYSGIIVIASLLLNLYFSYSVKGRIFKPLPNLERFSKFVWPWQVVFMFSFLLASEVFLLNWSADKVSTYYLEVLIMGFNTLWWLIMAYYIDLWIRRFIWVPLEERTNRKIPDIVRLLIALSIYLLALFGIIAFVFDQRLTSLLATSGVIAMIIGLAVQMNIANIFSGIAINLERPFEIGHWIKIGTHSEGKVIDINWRATRVLTRDDTVLTIPNSQASESPIENFSYPSDGYWKYFTIHVDPAHSPERVKKILLDSALAAEGVLNEPPPVARFLGLTAGMTGQSESWAANYLVGVYVKDYGKKFAHNEIVWTNLWNHLKYAGIRHIMERQEVHLLFEGIKQRKKEKISKPLAILQELYIFQPFSDDARAYLSNRMRQRFFPEGEIVVRQGDKGDSLFIIVEGTLGVWVELEDGKSIEVARLGAGNFFGEMALLTGEPRAATIISITDTYVFEITKKDISPLIEKQPQISWAISEVLSERKMATEAKKSVDKSTDMDKSTLAAQILNKIQQFFGFKK